MFWLLMTNYAEQECECGCFVPLGMVCDCEYDMEEWDYRMDQMLEAQEREDFCECDESYGCYGGDEW